MKKIFTVLLVCATHTLFAQQKDSFVVVPISTIDTNLFTKVDVEASFPGGESAWNQYILKKVERKVDKLSRDKASVGTCEVQFIVDRAGNITNVEALTMKNTLLSKILIDAIENGPKWVPAEQNGRKVKAWRRQRITFRAPE